MWKRYKVRLVYQTDSNAESKEASYGREERDPSLTGLTAELKDGGGVKIYLFFEIRLG